MDDRELLTQAGQALFGSRWQTEMARALDLSDARRIRGWLMGERRIPPGIWRDLLALIAARQQGIDAVVPALRHKIEARADD